MSVVVAMPDVLRVHAMDSVAVALRPLSREAAVTVGGVALAIMEDIPQGHRP